MRDRLRFYLNGKPVEVSTGDAFLTLSEFLRRRRGLTGTKVVCAEGDCGSCTVMIGRVDGERIAYSAVTSCIQILFQSDATHIVTVEGLRDGLELNPIQQAMVSCQGTQCGFCTPGFVVALQDCMNDRKAIDAQKVRRALTGNLCRCTGYDSIIQAALATDRAKLKTIDDLYPPADILKDLRGWTEQDLRIDAGARKIYKPVTREAATQFKSDNPGCSVICGATDLGVLNNKRTREINVALSLSGISSLRTVEVKEDALIIGSAVTLTTLQLLARDRLSELGRFLEWFGSPLIRNAATIGGNLVTGSPIGDTIPAMIALGAEVELTGIESSRWIPIGDFYVGYRATKLGVDELLTQVKIPLLTASQILKLYKVSRRKDLDISSFGAAIWISRPSEAIEDIRLAFGGVGPMVLRLPNTEAFLRGRLPTLELFQEASEMARREISPIRDVRGAAEYRRALAGNILIKFWHEVFGNDRHEPAELITGAA